MKPIITRFDKNSGDILLSIPMFDKDIFHRIQQIEKCNPSWFDAEHYNIFDLIKENQKYKKVIDKVSSQIKLYGKYDGEKCTRCFSMMTADFNKLLDILKEVE